jgi:hypothetical protein
MLKDTLSYFIIIFELDAHVSQLQCRLFGIGDLSVCGYILISDQLQYNVNNLYIVLIFFLKGHYLPKS